LGTIASANTGTTLRAAAAGLGLHHNVLAAAALARNVTAMRACLRSSTAALALLAVTGSIGPGSLFAGEPPTPPSAAARPVPGLRKLMDTPLRDTSISRGPDGTWYLTGTVEPFWAYNEGIQVWKSPNLTNWTALGFVWKYGDSPWHKPYLDAKKPLWAPEIHFLKGTFWLTYSLPGWDGTGKTSGCGLLKSTSGKAEGPYVASKADILTIHDTARRKLIQQNESSFGRPARQGSRHTHAVDVPPRASWLADCGTSARGFASSHCGHHGPPASGGSGAPGQQSLSMPA
jgi:hypothetical protein